MHITDYHFGPYQLKPRTRELYNRGTKLKLRPQPFRVLLILVERSGEVVTREELHSLLWPKETFVDFEQGLNTAIKELRGVLQDSAGEPRYIQTLPKLGYRMMAPVTAVHAPPPSEPIALKQIAPQDGPADSGIALFRGSHTSRLRRWAVLMGLSFLLLITLAGYFEWLRFRSRPQPTAGRVMLAVLPFENLTGDAGQEYFSEGLTEEMIAQLGQLNPKRLGVIGRTSVMQYQRSQHPLEQINRDLGVQYVLEGSVRRDSKNVRITAELIEMSDQKTIWSRQYDRELTSLLALQGEIAQKIADEIQLTLGGRGKQFSAFPKPAASSASYEAYDLYLKGRYFWNKRSTQGFQQAIVCFQQAIAKDPNYAQAYAGLADSYALTSSYNFGSPKDLMPKARAAALRALQIDATLAEAHTSLALIAENYDWDWQTAGKEFQRAIELDPGYPTAHQWYAEELAWQGRFDEAFVEMEQARRLDPLSLSITTDHAATLYYSRQYDRAIEELQTVIDMDPNFPRAHAILALSYLQKRQFPEAVASVEELRRIDPSPGVWVLEAYVYCLSGQPAQARRALAKFEQLNRHVQLDPTTSLALATAGTGDKDKFFASLQRAFLGRSNSLTALKVDPVYDPFRGDPRFQALLRQVGLAP